MIEVRRSEDRGRTRIGWLDSRHSFSFGEYFDPAQMGFRALRVINEDRVAPGGGFPTHPHRDMEILTWVLEGALAHEDSLGNASVIAAGDLQRMTAGTGVQHSEFNHSQTDPVHFLQIWIVPEARGLAPGYDQKSFPAHESEGSLRLLASRDSRNGSLGIHQDVDLFAADLRAGAEIVHELHPGRHAWLQVTRGEMDASGHRLVTGDGAAVSGEERLALRTDAGAGLLLFDLA